MITLTMGNILGYIRANAPVTASQISDHFSIHPTMTHRHLNKLLKEGKIRKSGKAPKVYYFPDKAGAVPMRTEDQDFLEDHFLAFGPDGKELVGASGFAQRCHDKKLNQYKALERYKETIAKVDKQRDGLGFIDALATFKKQFDKIYVDGLRLIDAYTIQEFGKSKLGNLAFYAKQSQSLNLIKHVIQLTRQKIYHFIKKYNIDGFCFAPPSLFRSPQFMDELKKGYALDQFGLQEIRLQKIFSGDVRIPQKSIKGTANRIQNAEHTIYLLGKQTKIKKLLLIDDFVASGATVNICAKKIRDKGLADKIYAISLLGNVDFSYEVINEV